MKDQTIRIGITQGDFNGIGYEIIIKTLMDPRIMEMCTPIVYGSPKVAAYHRKALNITNFSFNSIRSTEDANPKRANIINCLDDSVRVELGKSTSIAGEASLQSLERAVSDLKNGKIDALVTGPINKYNIQSKDFSFPGHTEYLKEKFSVNEVVMIMVSDVLKVGVVAGHVPVSEIPAHITPENIEKKIEVLNQALIQDFGVRKPKIAILGLNPHAGDEGVIGTEEKEIIIPVIQRLKEKGYLVSGPFPADGYFGSDYFTKFDATLAMYHDQGLAPFKAMVFDKGVNYTAGLPVIRTSPAHGTAYEIAGKNVASIDSFREALYLAIDTFKNRDQFKEITKNPVKKYAITEDSSLELPEEMEE